MHITNLKIIFCFAGEKSFDFQKINTPIMTLYTNKRKECSTMDENKNTTKKKTGFVIAGIIFVFLLLLGAGAFGMLKYREQQDKDASEEMISSFMKEYGHLRLEKAYELFHPDVRDGVIDELLVADVVVPGEQVGVGVGVKLNFLSGQCHGRDLLCLVYSLVTPPGTLYSGRSCSPPTPPRGGTCPGRTPWRRGRPPPPGHRRRRCG